MAGFEWAENDWHDGKHQVPDTWLFTEATGQAFARRTYAPLLEESGLFRTFADVAPTRESIKAFADEFGNLGVASLFFAEKGPEEMMALGVTGESLSRWTDEIGQMRQAVDVLDLLLAKDRVGLAQVFHWVEDHPETNPAMWICSSGFPTMAEGMAPFSSSDVLSPALGWLISCVNKKLQQQTCLALSYDPRQGWTRPAATPATLLVGMWLQLGMALSRPTKFKKCPVCQRWFSAAGRGRKAKQIFCRDRCKSADYKQRRAKAQQLAEEGKTAKAIGAEIQTPLATVKKWIAKKA